MRLARGKRERHDPVAGSRGSPRASVSPRSGPTPASAEALPAALQALDRDGYRSHVDAVASAIPTAVIAELPQNRHCRPSRRRLLLRGNTGALPCRDFRIEAVPELGSVPAWEGATRRYLEPLFVVAAALS
jgi:hypothetical protein